MSVEHREDVGPERALQLFRADVLQAILRVLLAGIVDQEVEPAERLDRSGHGFAAENLLTDIARDREAAPALLLDQRLGRLGVRVLVEIDDGDVRPLLGEPDRDRATDAAVTAGDQGGLTLELAGAPVVPHLRAGLWHHLRAQTRLPVLLLRRVVPGLGFRHGGVSCKG